MHRFGGKEAGGVESVSDSFNFLCEVGPRVNYWGEVESEVEWR